MNSENVIFILMAFSTLANILVNIGGLGFHSFNLIWGKGEGEGQIRQQFNLVAY